MPQAAPGQPPLLALGIDAGGTETRWALASPREGLVADGQAQAISVLDLNGPGQVRVVEALASLARDVLAVGRPARVHAGLTGLGTASEALARLIAGPFGLPVAAVSQSSDIETTYLDLFAPGQGYLVYAGTGSVAAFIDAQGALHRAGGRGVLIDDGGGGYWIAREGLRHVWRAEDERPGSWQDSPLAQELFKLVGGSDWACTRKHVYGGNRGDIGRLALAVVRAAERDPAARDILRAAGAELARLACALIGRYGARPLALSGRAATLHPLIAETMQAGLPPGTAFTLRPSHGEQAAARLALGALTGTSRPLLQELQP